MNITHRGQILRAGWMSLLLATLTLGCNQVDQDNVSKVRTGMTVQEVEKILGKPDVTNEKEIPLQDGSEIEIDGDEIDLPTTVRRSLWEDEGRTVTIIFIGNQVHRIEKEGM